jgi:phosphatidylserine/phosphatidylglycerophosphate/cardiolipin synthase-like enzyme
MPVEISAYCNCDDVVVFWRIDKPIPKCLGFALEREIVEAQGERRRSFVENRTGFAHSPSKPGESRSSLEWPFQRFSWTDHKMNLGDRVRYRIAPVLADDQGVLSLAVDGRSDWTLELELSGAAGNGTSSFFNRGLVISQFMARYLQRLQREKPGETWDQTLKRFKASLEEHEQPIRRFLSGELGTTLLNLLKKVKKAEGHLFAALYELEDDELLDALEAMGPRSHIVLANGSVKTKGGDQNKIARARLQGAEVEVFDRMLAPGALAHNKFLVVCDEKAKPLAAWTGSTNWTKTGLCTQINNGLLIENKKIAQFFLDQWNRLRDSGSKFPAELLTANSTAKAAKAGKSQVDLWFTRTSGGQDMEALRREINAAKEAILFLMFTPGPLGLYGSILERMKKSPNLYVHGVVSELPKLNDESAVDVSVFGSSGKKQVSLDIVQPQGIKTPFASWAATVTRDAFKRNVGIAIVHSKLVVIDPLTKPVVIAGSHNFSKSASGKNDENVVVIRGNRTLAQAYGVHILSVYHHYRWLAHVAMNQSVIADAWHGLSNSDKWQVGHLKGASRREMEFWVR